MRKIRSALGRPNCYLIFDGFVGPGWILRLEFGMGVRVVGWRCWSLVRRWRRGRAAAVTQERPIGADAGGPPATCGDRAIPAARPAQLHLQ